MQPSYKIIADGNDVTKAFAGRLVSLAITDVVGTKADNLEIVLEDSATNLQLPGRGAVLEVWLGYVGALQKIGLYSIDEVVLAGPPDNITLNGSGATWVSKPKYAALHTHKSRSWDAATMGAIVAKIAGEHGLIPEVSESAAAIAIPHQDQTDESDLNLLMRTTGEHDLMMKPAEGRLVVVSKAEGVTTKGKAIKTFTIRKQDCSNHVIKLRSKGTYTQVVTAWRDVRGNTTRDVVAGSGAPAYRAGVYSDAATAAAAANSMLANFRRSGASYTITVPGRADIFAEARLALDEFRPEVNAGVWRIDRVEHRLGRSGYTTTVSGVAANEILPPPAGE